MTCERSGTESVKLEPAAVIGWVYCIVPLIIATSARIESRTVIYETLFDSKGIQDIHGDELKPPRNL